MGDYLEAAKHTAKQQLALQKEVGKQNEAEMKYNAKEAATARDWQKMMSDTSHQREVKDLLAAGLNPVLAANQGAQSYTTSSASANLENAAGAMASVYSSAVGAQATQNAANSNAAAMKKAAAASAAAQRYAANRQAAAQEYAAYMNYKTKKDEYGWKTKYMEKEYKVKQGYENHIPVNSLFGLIDKWSNNAGAQDRMLNGSGMKFLVKHGFQSFPDLVKDYGKFKKMEFKTAAGFIGALNKKGKSFFSDLCNRLNIADSSKNYFRLYNGLFLGRESYLNSITRQLPKKNRQHSSSSLNGFAGHFKR